MSMSPIRLITFDLDNTLWDADPVLLHAEQTLRRWLRDKHPALSDAISFPQMLALKKQIMQSNPELAYSVSALRLQVLRQLFLNTGYQPAQASAFAEQAFEVFYQARQQVQLFDEVIPLLERLSKDFMLASLSNGNADPKIIGLDRYFQFSLNADQVGAQKPAPDMFNQALSISALTAHQVIHVGDHLKQDVWAAQQVGIQAIWVNLKGAEGSREVDPDATVESLQDLPNKIDQLSK